MPNFFKRWLHSHMKMPTSDQIAIRELEQARVELLEAQKHNEYYIGAVSILQTRIHRLERRAKGQ